MITSLELFFYNESIVFLFFNILTCTIKNLMILLAFQFYIHVAPAGSLPCKLENTTDEKEKTTLKE